MARVRLYLIDNDRQPIVDGGQNEIQLIYLRVTAMFRLPSENALRDGIFDTGTALTVFPETIWRRFEHTITWLAFPSEKPIPAWWTSVSGLTGGKFTCRIGRITMTLVDLEHARIEGIPIIGKFVEDQGKLPDRILLGLAHGVLQGRQLRIDDAGREAWLEDRA